MMAPFALPGGWSSRSVGRSLPLDRAWALCRSARRFDRARGGRFGLAAADGTTNVVLLWAPDRSVVRGAVVVRWGGPAPDEARLEEVCWRPDAGGTEEEVWHALELLAGGPLAGA